MTLETITNTHRIPASLTKLAATTAMFVQLTGVGIAPSYMSQVRAQEIMSISKDGVVAQGSFRSDLNAPGGLSAVFGDNLGEQVCISDEVPLPTTSCDGTQVFVNGEKAPLFYTSPSQVNFQMPYVTGPVDTWVERNGMRSNTQQVILQPAISLLGYTVEGTTQGVAVNLDNELINVLGPGATAEPGKIFTLYAVGGPNTTGSIVPPGTLTPADELRPITGVEYLVNGQKLEDVVRGEGRLKEHFVGLSPGGIGLDQLNLEFEGDTRPGIYELTVKLGERISNTVSIGVAPKGAPFLLTKTTLEGVADDVEVTVFDERNSVAATLKTKPGKHELTTVPSYIQGQFGTIVVDGLGNYYNTAIPTQLFSGEVTPVVKIPVREFDHGTVTFNKYAPRIREDVWQDTIQTPGNQKLNNMILIMQGNRGSLGENQYLVTGAAPPPYKVYLDIPEDQKELFRPYIQSWNTVGLIFEEDTTKFWERGESGVVVKITSEGNHYRGDHINKTEIIDGRAYYTQHVGIAYLNENLHFGDLAGNIFAHELGHNRWGHTGTIISESGTHNLLMDGKKMPFSPWIEGTYQLPEFEAGTMWDKVHMTHNADLNNIDHRPNVNKEDSAVFLKEQRQIFAAARNIAALSIESGTATNIVGITDLGPKYTHALATVQFPGTEDGLCGGYQQLVAIPRQKALGIISDGAYQTTARSSVQFADPTIKPTHYVSREQHMNDFLQERFATKGLGAAPQVNLQKNIQQVDPGLSAPATIMFSNEALNHQAPKYFAK